MVWQRTLSSFLYLFVIAPAVNLNTYAWQLVQSRDVWAAEIVSCKALYFSEVKSAFRKRLPYGSGSALSCLWHCHNEVNSSDCYLKKSSQEHS